MNVFCGYKTQLHRTAKDTKTSTNWLFGSRLKATATYVTAYEMTQVDNALELMKSPTQKLQRGSICH